MLKTCPKLLYLVADSHVPTLANLTAYLGLAISALAFEGIHSLRA